MALRSLLLRWPASAAGLAAASLAAVPNGVEQRSRPSTCLSSLHTKLSEGQRSGVCVCVCVCVCQTERSSAAGTALLLLCLLRCCVPGFLRS